MKRQLSRKLTTRELIQLASARRATAIVMETLNLSTGRSERFWVGRLAGRNVSDQQNQWKHPSREQALASARWYRQHVKDHLAELGK